MEYTPTGPGVLTPLTLAAYRPSWEDYLDLGKSVTEMAQCLMEKDGQQVQASSRASATPKPMDVAHVMPLHYCPQLYLGPGFGIPRRSNSRFLP